MNLKISHAEGAFLKAQAKFEAWQEGFLRQWKQHRAEEQWGMQPASMSEGDEAHLGSLQPKMPEDLAGMMDEMNTRGGA